MRFALNASTRAGLAPDSAIFQNLLNKQAFFMKTKYYILHSLLVVALIAIVTVIIWHSKTTTQSSFATSTSVATSATESTSSKSLIHSSTETVPVQAKVAAKTEVTPQETSATSSATTNATSTPEKNPALFAHLVIGSQSYDLPIHEDETLLDAMQALQSSTSFDYSGRQYTGLGFFVMSINGKAAADGFNWMLYVDGRPSEYGASALIIKTGQKIEWKYEK
ncbi:MAG: hypothetical protein JWO50_279 [Candidatus Kaiserbacteria bacterium]|nr:hypothetical protein [Candidatus Kaiserbacteria bacterium]